MGGSASKLRRPTLQRHPLLYVLPEFLRVLRERVSYSLNAP